MSRSVVSNVLRASLGNLIEWFDFYSYTIFAVYLGAHFFRGGDPLSEQLEAFSVFALSFIMRPIGSWLFGRIADQHGRRLSMTVSVLLMATGSLLIALAPGYDTIGAAATLILVFARLLQGLSVGGEYGISSTYLSEVASPNRRGFYSSFQYTTLIGGQLCALIVQIVLRGTLSTEQLTAWGWRIPFGLGALAALTVLWLRRGMTESLPEAQHAAALRHGDGPRPGTLRLLARYWRTCLTVFGITSGGTLAFYTLTTYTNLTMGGGALPASTVSLVMFLVLTLALVLQPLIGALSDRVGRKPVLIAFGCSLTVLAWPVLWANAHAASGAAAFGILAIAILCLSGYTATNAIVKAELFPSSVRALGVGLSYGIANMLFGGTAPMVGTWFQTIGHPTWFYGYVTVIVFASLCVIIFALPGHRRSPLDVPGSVARPDEPLPAPGIR